MSGLHHPKVSALRNAAFVGSIAAAVMVAAALVGAAPPVPPVTAVAPGYVAGSCNTWDTPFCNAAMNPIPGWTGHVFHLSQQYPQQAGLDPHGPWLRIDPKREPGRFTRALLDYFYEGNIHSGSIENDFDPALNHVRRWYNAPFQDLGLFGREFVHGLTEERNSAPHELTPQQSSVWANYAVGYYNAPGGAVIKHVWDPWRVKAGAQPSIAAAKTVPEGTVAAKLLFTTASTAEAPFLKDAPAWNAYIYKDVHNYPTLSTPPPAPTPPSRAIGKVRLLQIDVAVKDHRAGPTGWFFGTFVYAGGPGYTGPTLGTGWRNVAPVGLMWGNDPGFTPPSPEPSPPPTPGTGLKESWLNPSVHMLHYGYQGRLNGPVDNPASSCMSCHSTGEVSPKNPTASGSGMFFPMPPPPATPAPASVIAKWFRNIGPSEPFDTPGFDSTGYSLQVMDGLRNYYRYLGATPAPKGALRAARVLKAVEQKVDNRPPRDGGTSH